MALNFVTCNLEWHVFHLIVINCCPVSDIKRTATWPGAQRRKLHMLILKSLSRKYVSIPQYLICVLLSESCTPLISIESLNALPCLTSLPLDIHSLYVFNPILPYFTLDSFNYITCMWGTFISSKTHVRMRFAVHSHYAAAMYSTRAEWISMWMHAT
jgi:hypothetical protein